MSLCLFGIFHSKISIATKTLACPGEIYPVDTGGKGSLNYCIGTDGKGYEDLADSLRELQRTNKAPDAKANLNADLRSVALLFDDKERIELMRKVVRIKTGNTPSKNSYGSIQNVIVFPFFPRVYYRFYKIGVQGYMLRAARFSDPSYEISELMDQKNADHLNIIDPAVKVRQQKEPDYEPDGFVRLSEIMSSGKRPGSFQVIKVLQSPPGIAIPITTRQVKCDGECKVSPEKCALEQNLTFSRGIGKSLMDFILKDPACKNILNSPRKAISVKKPMTNLPKNLSFVGCEGPPYMDFTVLSVPNSEFDTLYKIIRPSSKRSFHMPFTADGPWKKLRIKEHANPITLRVFAHYKLNRMFVANLTATDTSLVIRDKEWTPGIIVENQNSFLYSNYSVLNDPDKWEEKKKTSLIEKELRIIVHKNLPGEIASARKCRLSEDEYEELDLFCEKTKKNVEATAIQILNYWESKQGYRLVLFSIRADACDGCKKKNMGTELHSVVFKKLKDGVYQAASGPLEGKFIGGVDVDKNGVSELQFLKSTFPDAPPTSIIYALNGELIHECESGR